MNSKEQKEKFLQLAELLRVCCNAYSQAIKGGDITSLVKEIQEAETQGDHIQHELDNFYAQSKSIPYLALDRAQLLQRIDDTLDSFAYGARILNMFGSFVPDEVSGELPKLSEYVTEIGNHLADAIEIIFTDFQASLGKVSKIEETRDAVVELAFDIETSFFKSAAENDWKKYRALHELLSRTLGCTSAMKRTSEVLSLMAYKYD